MTPAKPELRGSYGLFILVLCCAGLLPGAAEEPALSGNAGIRHARGFSVETKEGRRIVTVREPWRGAKESFRYVLVGGKSPLPKAAPGETVLRVPAGRAALGSITFVAHAAMLGALGNVAGIASSELVVTPEARRLIEAGKIAELGSGGMDGRMNMERLLRLQPDLVMLYGMGRPDFDSHPKLMEAGLPVVMNGEQMESTPLGRAEWIKFVALFFGREEEAERIFSDIEKKYLALSRMAAASPARPTVFTSIDFKGTWYMPGGGSFMAKFIEDAGGRYLWDDDRSTGSIPLSAEAVVARALNADFWLNPGVCGAKKDILLMDGRYGAFRAFKEGRIYHNSVRLNKSGGNDYWENGVANPHLILMDLIRIFHPELLPEHVPVWHARME